MSASLLRSDEQRWPSRQTWQATMGHSLGAPPMCVVAVLFKVCERNSRSLRTTTVYHAQTSKPFDLEFKGTITQKVHHLKHRQLPDHWPIGAVASPWTWISSKNLGCNHYETVEIFNSNLNRIFMTLITKQDPHSDAESRNLFVLELLIIFRPICFENTPIFFIPSIGESRLLCEPTP